MALLSKNITVTLTPEENMALASYIYRTVKTHREIYESMPKNMQEIFVSAVRKFSREEEVITFNEEMDKNL